MIYRASVTFCLLAAFSAVSLADRIVLATSGQLFHRVFEDGSTEVFDIGLDLSSIHRDLDTGEIFATGSPARATRRYYRVTNATSGTPAFTEIGQLDRAVQAAIRLNGTIYGVNRSSNVAPTNLYSFNPTDLPEAPGTLVGDTGLDDGLGGVLVHGMTWDPHSETAYILARRNALYEIDLNDGSTTLATRFADDFGVGAMSYYNGEIYTLTGTNANPDDVMRIGTVDPITGSYTFLYNIPSLGPKSGLLVIPEPATALLLLLGCGIASRRGHRMM